MINQKEINKIEDEKMRIDLQNDNAPKLEAMSPQLGIKIEICLDGEPITERYAFDFEGAEENLGKLRKWYEEEQAKMEAEAERNQEEINDLEKE